MKESIAKAPSSRPQRTPIGRRGRLTVKDKDPNFVYRFVNDRDDRIEMFKEAGYEVASGSVAVGDKRLDNPSPIGSGASVSVGLGDKAVLMRIPKEWNDEDQAAKLAKVNATEETIKQKASNGYKGKFERDKDFE